MQIIINNIAFLHTSRDQIINYKIKPTDEIKCVFGHNYIITSIQKLQQEKKYFTTDKRYTHYYFIPPFQFFFKNTILCNIKYVPLVRFRAFHPMYYK
uniref:Uncharacterized protein n=1 Tax=Megaviridae environmental sample TaxID=1737588 RepID=A0A5J6VIP4_9VIRU|nr:MAG: hypothetical protein [Megaviridae environmental sample]